MSYERTFNNLLKIENTTRLLKEHYKHKHEQINGEDIYIEFKVWCNAYNSGNGKNNAKLFAKFLKEQEIELNFWQKKYLAEKYFGYKYNFDRKKSDWEIKKV